MTVTTAPAPATVFGIPLSSWAFAVRIWVAVVVSLYSSFWLQLEAPSSAALTVAILALPTRGPALEKAGFRLAATIVGVAASIAIVGIFSQVKDLLLLAFAVWMGLCLYVAGLSDGSRAYAAVLAGYTVAFIAIQQIDSPNQIFQSGMERGAAIAVGVVALAIVNDLLVAPDRHLGMAAQLAGIHSKVRNYAKASIRGGATDSTLAADLLREIAALRPEMTGLAAESSSGWTRSSAARSTAVALVAQIHTVRVLGALPIASDTARREQLMSALVDEIDLRSLAAPFDWRHSTHDAESGLTAAASAWASAELLRRDQQVRDGLAALQAGRPPVHIWRTPFYSSHRIAAAAGVRATLWLALASTVFVFAGWPAADASLSLVAVLIGLGATTPSPRGFTAMALVALPIAIALAGILEFVILDGVTEFPLLAIALAPFMIGATVLMTLPNPAMVALGRLNLIFILAIFAPSNPQTYNPQGYLFTSLFVCLAGALLFAAQLLLPPISDERHRQWLIESARRDRDRILARKIQRYSAEEAMFRDAVRIGQIAGSGSASSPPRALLCEALILFDEAAMLRLSVATLSGLTFGPLGGPADVARRALSNRDEERIRHAAFRFDDAAAEHGPAPAGSVLFATSLVMGAVTSRTALLEEARAA